MRNQGIGRCNRNGLYPIGLVVGCWLASFNSATAQTDTHADAALTMHEVVQQAIAWHPSIAESLGNLYQQSEQVEVARSGYRPQIDAGLSTEYRTSSNQTEEALNFIATQRLYDFGKVNSDIERQKYGVERDQALVLEAVDQLALDVSQTVIENHRFKELLQVAEAQVEGIREIKALANKRAALGASTQSDIMQAQSRLEAAQEIREQFTSQLMIAGNQLRRLMGREKEVNLVDALPEGLNQACSVTNTQFNQVPEIKAADAQREEARAQIERRQADFYPTITAEARLNQFINQIGNGDDTDFTLRLNVSSSLYQGGATQAQRRSADFALQASQASRDGLLLELESRLQDAQEQSRSGMSRIDILEARSASIEKTQEVYRKQYLSLGTRSLLDLLNAEQEIHQASFDKVNVHYDIVSTQLECLYLSSGFRAMFDINDEVVQGVSLNP